MKLSYFGSTRALIDKGTDRSRGPKPSTRPGAYVPPPPPSEGSFFLLENGDYILLESGDYITMES